MRTKTATRPRDARGRFLPKGRRTRKAPKKKAARANPARALIVNPSKVSARPTGVTMVYAAPKKAVKRRRKKNPAYADFASKLVAGGVGFVLAEQVDNLVQKISPKAYIKYMSSPIYGILTKLALAYLIFKKGGKVVSAPSAKFAAVGFGASAFGDGASYLMSKMKTKTNGNGNGATAGLLPYGTSPGTSIGATPIGVPVGTYPGLAGLLPQSAPQQMAGLVSRTTRAPRNLGSTVSADFTKKPEFSRGFFNAAL